MCDLRLTPATILAALALGHAAPIRTTCPDAPARWTCLECLAEALHDAADLVEGMAERITPPPAP